MSKAPLSQTVVLTEDGTTVTLAIADAVTIPPLIPPIFSAAPVIQRDGDPVPGVLLTGVDPLVAHGIIISRRWVRNGVQIATSVTVRADVAGTYTFEVSARGAGITITASVSVTITVPAPGLATTLAGDDQVQASAVTGFAARYEAQRTWLAARGITLPQSPTGSVRSVFAAIETALRQARAAAESPANTLTYQGQALTYQGQPLTYGASA